MKVWVAAITIAAVGLVQAHASDKEFCAQGGPLLTQHAATSQEFLDSVLEMTGPLEQSGAEASIADLAKKGTVTGAELDAFSEYAFASERLINALKEYTVKASIAGSVLTACAERP